MRTVWVVLAAVGLSACGRGGSSSPVTTPVTAPATTGAATTSTASTASTATTTATTAKATTSTAATAAATTTVAPSAPAALVDLLGPLASAAGTVVVLPAGDVTVVTSAGEERSGANAAVVQAGGVVTVLPPTVGRVERVVRQGGSVLLLSRSNQVDRFVLEDRRLERVPLPLPTDRRVSLVPAGDVVLAVSWDVQDFVSSGGPSSVRTDVVHADGTVSPAAPPPDPWAVALPGTMTVWTGRELVTYAAESAAFDGGLRHPAAYDPAANTWRTLSDPPWAGCADACTWFAPHQGGDRQAIGWTGERTFVRISLGDTEVVALHDVERDTWERLPALPIPVSDTWLDASPARVVLFSNVAVFDYPGATPASTLGTAAVLDLASRSWSSVVFATPGPDEYFCPVPLVAGTYVAACPTEPSGPGSPAVAPVVFDRASGAWAPPTESQRLEALRAGPLVALSDLAAAVTAG